MAKLPRLLKRDSSPRKQVTGTSYQAKGAIAPAPADYSEIGSAGFARPIDPVPELGNRQQAIRTYTKMVRSDVSVRTSLRAGKAPVLGGEYWFEPYDDTPEALVAAEFASYNLFGGMSTPWLKTLEQILKMYEDGFSAFEPVWELREWAPKKVQAGANRRQYTMLKKLAVRPASTVNKFNYDDNGGPVEMEHNALDKDGKPKLVKIPINKLCVFTFDQDGGDLMGNPILRSAYEHWYYKYYLYKIDGIQKERHGIGVPEVELQPGYDANDLRYAHELVTNLRTNEKAGIVRTTLMKVGFAELKGQPVDALGSAMHHDNMIMKNVLVQFLNLGIDSSGGGRATGATAMDMMLKAMKFIAQTICDSINLYIIPNLHSYNFPDDKFPKLQVRGIGEAKDYQMFSAALANLAEKRLITLDLPTEQWVRQQFDMPKKIGERPANLDELGVENINELLQGSLDTGGNLKGAGNIPPTNGKTPGPSVQGGNIGKSPSSGAT